MRSLRRNITIVGLVGSMFCAIPLRVQAAPELAVTTKDIPKAARADVDSGRKASLAGDAEGAVEAWSRVLASTPESTKTRRFRMLLIVDTIAVALDAHAQTPNLPLLERTLDVYYAYFAAHEATYGNPNIPGPVVEARFALKEAVDQAKATDPAPAEPTTAPPPPTSAPPPSDTISLSSQDLRRGDGTGLLVAGGITLAIGAGLTSLIAVGAVNRKNTRKDLDNPAYSEPQRDRIEQQEHAANAMFVAGLVSAPVALVTGAVLLGVGAKRRSDTHRYATITPTLSRSQAGLSIQGRF